eukprot:3146187-Pyramimonas_sp.AAC.1
MRMLCVEGGPKGLEDPQTIADCRQTCVQCIELGYPYIQADPQNGSVKFLKFRLEYKDRFKQMWQRVTQQDSTPALADGDTEAEPAPEPQRPPKKPKATPPETVALSQARRFITSSQMSITAAEKLETLIQSPVEGNQWAWANCKDVVGMITKALRRVNKCFGNNTLAQLLLAQTQISK